MEEKRKKQRVRISFPVRCEPLKTHKSFYTVFRDISEGGVKLITEDFMSINTFLKCEINLVEELIRAKGKVVWSSPQPYSDRYYTGIEFTEIEPKSQERLSKFISYVTS